MVQHVSEEKACPSPLVTHRRRLVSKHHSRILELAVQDLSCRAAQLPLWARKKSRLKTHFRPSVGSREGSKQKDPVEALTFTLEQQRGPLSRHTRAIPAAARLRVSHAARVVDSVPGGEGGGSQVAVGELGVGVAAGDRNAASPCCTDG